MKNFFKKSKEKIKGFTLIEIIVCLIIITCIGTGSVIGVNTVIKNNKESKLEKIHTNFDSALEVYLTDNKEVLANINNYAEGAIITLETLKNEGLISDDLIDPTTDELIDYKNNYYVVSNAVLLENPGGLGGAIASDACNNQVSIEVIANWDLNNLTEAQKSQILYICPTDIDRIKSSLTGLDSRISDLETEIGNLKEAIKEVEGVKTEDVKQNLIYSSLFENATYTAKGVNPNNYVYFEVESKPNEFAYFQNTDNKGLWRIVSINETNEIELLYSEPVLSNNSQNYTSESGTWCHHEGWQDYNGDYSSCTYYKLKHTPSEAGMSNSKYYKYNTETTFLPSELLEAETIEGSKKSYLYNSIVNEDWIIEKNYHPYYSRSGNNIVYNPSSNKAMKMGSINENQLKSSVNISESWLYGYTMMMGSITYSANFVDYYYYVYNSGGTLRAGTSISAANKCTRKDCYYDKDSSQHFDLYGTNYYPLITLSSKVELIENSSCDKNAIQGSKECPYKLKCTEC